MRKLLWLLLLINSCFVPQLQAATCATLSGTVSQTSFSNALSTCGIGNTVVLSAGTVVGPIISTINYPTGVSITGPVVTYSQTPNQTAKIIGSSSFNGPAFSTAVGSNASAIQYIEWDGMQPSNGGAFIQIIGGTNNFTINNNYLHGASGPNPDTGNLSILTGQIRIGTGPGSVASSNISILNNVFGSATVSDCGQAMNETNTEDSTGGLCNGVVLNGIQNGVYIRYNIFRNLEEGTKLIESTTNHGTSYNSGTCELCYIEYNHYIGIQRIPIETQSNGVDSSHSTLQYVRYNDFMSRHTGGGGAQGYDISDANGCGNVDADYCITHTDFNVDVANIGPSVGLEIWGLCDSTSTPCTTASYNLIQGNMYNGITWDKSGHFQFYHNTFQQNSIGTGSSTDCTAHKGGYWNWDGADGTVDPAFAPDCTVGNTYTTTILTLGSVAPTVSPAGSAVASGTVITIANPGTNRDTNTTDWCRTDGMNPVPGDGVSTIMTSYIVTSAVTLKCVGMWGAFNQPYSYPSGYGYVPSAVVTNSYTVSGTTPTASSPTFSPAAGTYTSAQTVILSTISSRAIICYNLTGSPATNGSTGCATGSTLYSSGITVSSSETIYAVAGGTGYLDSSVINATYTISATNPTITSGYLGNPGSQNTIQIGAGTIQFVAYVYYSNGTGPSTLPDSYGNTPIWTIVPGSSTCGTVTPYVSPANPGGLFTPTTVGTCNVSAQVSGAPHISQWTMTISAGSPTLTSITLASTGNVTQLTVGATNQLIATGHYSDGSTANVTSTVNAWATSNGAYATISSGGLVTAVATGSPTFTATIGSITSPAFPLQIITGVSLQSVTVSNPGNINVMYQGWTLPFTATCNFSDGSSTPCRNPTWVSSNIAAATISSTGILEEISSTQGNGTVTATQSPITSAPYSMIYTGTLPVTFSLTGVKMTFTGNTITLSYK